MHKTFQLVKQKQSDHSEDVGIDGRIKLIWAVQEQALYCR